MPYAIRTLTVQDQPAAWKLGSLAFGYHDREMPASWTSDSPGRVTYGAFAEDGALVAKAVDRAQGQWFGGRIVPASGIAGVVVAPELRSQGLGRLVLTHLLAQARERGAVISTLFPTTPFPYRRLGWEEAGALTYLALPTSALTPARPSPGVRLRPATGADLPAIQDVYRVVARESSGMMERSGPLFDKSPIEDFDGVTVAVEAGVVTGYATWDRSPGYDESGKVTVEDLIGVTPQATDTLLAMLAGWASVAPTVALLLSDPDPAWFSFASGSAKVHSRQPWMIRVVDAVGAAAARGWPAHLDAQVDLHLEDEVCPWNAGPHRLMLSGGEARLEPGGSGEVRMTARGFALWYAGAATPSILRRSGLLTGGSAGTHQMLMAATAGPPPALHDYF